LSEVGRTKTIPLAEPKIGGNEWRYIKDCLDIGWVSSIGDYVDRFEREIAAQVGVEYGVAMINGTASLHMALVAVGVEAEDEVLIPSLTFIAPANAIRYVGAWPVFIDADPANWQMDPQRLVDFVENECLWRDGILRNKLTGRRVKAMLPVHILGHPTDMDSVMEVARKYSLVVIEDATESLGALYKDQQTGSIGDIACFSFNGNKIITTGGGGMVVTNNGDWARRIRYLTTQAKDDKIEYVHKEVGYNYRLSNIQAAMGCAQLEQLDIFIATKRQIAATYNEGLKGVPGIEPMRQSHWALGTWWMYTVLVDESEFGMSSRSLIALLGEKGIQCRPLWQPLHMSPAHSGGRKTDCTVAEMLYIKGVSLPCSAGLGGDELSEVIRSIHLISDSHSVA
jgi:perosamine synthetase